MAVMVNKRKRTTPPTALAKRIYEARGDLTLHEAAEKVGVSWRTWAAWEAGRVPSEPILKLLRLTFPGKKI